MYNVDFLQLPHTLKYPPTLKSTMSTAHANAISQFLSDYTGSYIQRKNIVHILNCISYMYLTGDSIPTSWNIDDPLHTYVDVQDDDTLSQVLSDLYIAGEKSLDWKEADAYIKSSVEPSESTAAPPTPSIKTSTCNTTTSTVTCNDALTDKSDLYIQSPLVPQFDVKTPWKAKIIDGTTYVVYTSLPLIPTRQNEISATTDVNLMSDQDLLKLYPNNLIQTRASIMYDKVYGCMYDIKLGVIFPIEGFTEEQVVDNIIKYPHLFRLLKQVDGELKSFYSSIEIDGQLHKISDIWYDLPVSKCVPYNKDYIKEYVVRRYLLEQDIKHVEHRYKMYGSLEPYLTLFMPTVDYIHMGYTDIVGLAKSCVKARVSYKQSRNPVLRRISDE